DYLDFAALADRLGEDEAADMERPLSIALAVEYARDKDAQFLAGGGGRPGRRAERMDEAGRFDDESL
ncbi:MAG: hypothetical protein ACC742_17305, partial [Thermoanaerobaculales bacterium]